MFSAGYGSPQGRYDASGRVAFTTNATAAAAHPAPVYFRGIAHPKATEKAG